MRSLLFFLGPGAHETLCALSKSGVSVSPSPVEFLRSNPAGLQSQMLCGLLLLLPDPQAGEPDVGLRTFTPVGELLWYNFPVCGSPTQQVRDLILLQLCPLLPSHCGFFFLFGCRISFLVDSSGFVDGCSSVVILLFL